MTTLERIARRAARATGGLVGSIEEGCAADALLADDKFVAEWRELHEGCRWATAFQGPDFVRTWYGVYRATRTPLLVLARSADGRLAGLLALSRTPGAGGVAHAGEHHAEYQVWIARPEWADAFIEAALDLLEAHFPSARVQFLFLPSGAPLGWLRPGTAWAGRTALRPIPHPWMTLEQGAATASLRKKSNKSRLNRLEREGRLSFERLRTRQELEAALPTIMDQTDLRQGAVHDSIPFRSDPLKRELYLALMEQPELLHATVMRVGGEIVSSHVGVRDGGSVSLGLISHSPFHAQHSPGKLHLLLLAAELATEGFDSLDLTPGGGYKDRFATRHEEAYVLDVFFSRRDHLRHAIRQRLARAAKAALTRAGIEPQRAKAGVGAALRRAAAIARRGSRNASVGNSAAAPEWYVISAADAVILPQRTDLHVDRISDVLLYDRARPADPSVSQFLSAALTRIEEGQQLITSVEGGRLAHCQWIGAPPAELLPAGDAPGDPSGAVALLESYTHPEVKSFESPVAHLRECARAAGLLPGARWVFVPAPADPPAASSLEKLGFRSVSRGWEMREGSAAPTAKTKGEGSAPSPRSSSEVV